MIGSFVPAALLVLAAPCEGPGPRIDTVLVENTGVAPATMLDRLAGAFHVRTRASVIRRTVLLSARECYDSARVAESVRALWGLGVFRDVRLDTLRVSDGLLALRVVTADGWSGRPITDYARAAGRTTWEVGFLEQNFLGSATQVSASYRTTPDRATFAASYYNPHFAVRNLMFYARHAQMSNGRYTSWTVGLPYRETAARRSLLLDGENQEERGLIYGEQTTVSDYRVRAVRLRLTAGVALRATSRSYTRLWTAARWRSEGWSPTLTDPFQTAHHAAAGAGLELGRVRWHVTQGFNTYGRQEWVDLSQIVRVGVWVAPRAWGYSTQRSGIGMELRWQLAAATPRLHAVLRADASGAWVRGGVLDSAQARARITFAARPAARHTVVAHGDAGAMFGERPPGGYDLWLEQRGPRLFPPHALTGPRVWWAGFEHRALVAASAAGLVGVGVATFVEYAQTKGYSGTITAGGNAGLALRVAPLRTASADVTELAVGRRFGQGAEGGWVLGFRKAVVW